MSIKDKARMTEIVSCCVELERYEDYESLNRLEMSDWWEDGTEDEYNLGALSIELLDVSTLYFTAESFEHAHLVLEKIEAYLGGTHVEL